MAGVIVQLDRTLTRNRMTGGKAAQIALGATLGFGLAAGTLMLALLDVPAAARLDLIALVLGLWLIGWLVAPSFTGGPELTGQYFRLHPIRRSTLTRGLFATAWRRMPALVALVAFAVVVVAAIPHGFAAVAVSIPAVALSVAVLVLASRLTAIWFAAVSKSRVGAVIGSIVTAAIIVVAQHSWIILIAIMINIDTGLPSGLGTALRVLPSSWGLLAVTAAANGEWIAALGALGGLALLGVLLYVLWTRLVTTAPLRSSVVTAPHRDRTPPLGSTRKELLGWMRDPLRLQDIVLPIAYAIGTCALPLIVGFGGLLPFTGVTLMIMGLATSCNLYGANGTALWMLLLSPGTERADVRGRQRAWLTVFGGLGILFTVIGVLMHPDPALLPWVIGSFLAVLGAGAGLVAYLSVHALVPVRDPHTTKHSPAEHSDLTGPAFLAIFATLALAAPTAGLLLAAQLSGTTLYWWAGLAMGLLTALLAPWALGAAAIRRLSVRGPELMHRMQSGPARPELGSDESEEGGAASDGTGSAAISGFEAMRAGESTLFWTLYTAAALAIVPQGIVAAGHLLADSGVTSWFLALHMPTALQWPVVGGFLALGAVLAAAAMRTYTRARRRERRREENMQ